MTTEDKIAARGIVNSDIDPQGNVVLWDHGPSEPGPLVDPDGDDYKRLEVEAKEWHAKYGDSAVPLTMSQGDARHAIEVEPQRYSLDPDVSEADVEAEIKKIQEQRAEAEKVTAERATAVQLAADRKIAIAAVLAARRTAALEAKAPKPRSVVQPEHAGAGGPAWYPQPEPEVKT